MEAAVATLTLLASYWDTSEDGNEDNCHYVGTKHSSKTRRLNGPSPYFVITTVDKTKRSMPAKFHFDI